MSKNTNPIFVGERKTWAIELDNGDGTTVTDVVTAGNNGSLVEILLATSTDTNAVEIKLALSDGTNSFDVGSATVAAGAGTDGGTTPAVDVLNATDLPWLRDALELGLESGWKLQAGAYAAITSGKVVHLAALGGDY